MGSRFDECSRRLWAATEAEALGYGGVSVVARATGISRRTVNDAKKEIARGIILAADKTRKPGGGRKAAIVHQPELSARLEALIDPQLSDELGIPISVCHFPPGTSKWNKVEHRLFSFISGNWRGEPLVNYETVVNLHIQHRDGIGIICGTSFRRQRISNWREIE